MKKLLGCLFLLFVSVSAFAEDGMLVLKTTPKDVAVYVNGDKKGIASELLVLNVRPGKYKIKIVKGKQSAEKEYNVPSGGIVQVVLALEGGDDSSQGCKDDPFTSKDESLECARNAWIKQVAGFTNSIGMKFVPIPPGEFTMGSNESSDEKPPHKVTITKGFYMGQYEVTQEQWYKVMGNNPSYYKTEQVGVDSRNHPVEQVSWEDAQGFIQKLNQRDNRKSYRLCTEAEWEYAARAGTTTQWSCGDNESCLGNYAWYSPNSGAKTHPVGQKSPNQWGLYDMHGNVWEWVQDWYADDYYGSSPSSDPRGPNSGSGRVVRGGGFLNVGGSLRSVGRGINSPGDRLNDLGFRLCSSL
ncbi:formylglycine-generating enzyme family protein [Deltaproteobacteria bacterium TL4]